MSDSDLANASADDQLYLTSQQAQRQLVATLQDGTPSAESYIDIYGVQVENYRHLCYVVNQTSENYPSCTEQSPCWLEDCFKEKGPCQEAEMGCVVVAKRGEYGIKKPHILKIGMRILGEGQDLVKFWCVGDEREDSFRREAIGFKVKRSPSKRKHSAISNVAITDCYEAISIAPEGDDGSDSGTEMQYIELDHVKLENNFLSVKIGGNEDDRNFAGWGHFEITLKFVTCQNPKGSGVKAVSAHDIKVSCFQCNFANHDLFAIAFEQSTAVEVNVEQSNFSSSFCALCIVSNSENITLSVMDSSFDGHTYAIQLDVSKNVRMKSTSCTYTRNMMGFLSQGVLHGVYEFESCSLSNNHENGLRLIQGTGINMTLKDLDISGNGFSGVNIYAVPSEKGHLYHDPSKDHTSSIPTTQDSQAPTIYAENLTISKNSIAGIIFRGIGIRMVLRSSTVSDSTGTGIKVDCDLEKKDAGSSGFEGVGVVCALGDDECTAGRSTLSIRDSKIVFNGAGVEFGCDKLIMDNTTVAETVGAGVQIRKAIHVEVTRCTIFNNGRGVSCAHDSVKKDNGVSSQWKIGNFVYMNLVFDVECPVRPHPDRKYDNLVTRVHCRTFLWHLSILAVMSDVVLVLPPVLWAKRRHIWGAARYVARVCVFALFLTWGFTVFVLINLKKAMNTTRHVLHYMPKRQVGMWQTCLGVAVSGLVSGLVARVTVEIYAARWTHMRQIQEHTEEEEELKRKQLELQGRIRKPEVSNRLHTFHHKARTAWLRNEVDRAQDILAQMKPIAEEEHYRLGKLAGERRELYAEEVHRWACLARIKSIKHEEPVQKDVPNPEVLRMYGRRRHRKSAVQQDASPSDRIRRQEAEDEDSYIEYIHQQAEWCMPAFCETLTACVQAVNNSKTPMDLTRHKFLRRGHDFHLPFAPSTHKLKPERRANAMGDNCALLLASIKDKARGREKVINDYMQEADKKERPAGRYVCDWLRASVITEDPYTLAVLFEVICQRMNLVRVKNNFTAAGLDDIKATNMLANFELDANLTTNAEIHQAKHVVEIQFLLQDLYTIKFVDHRLYEVLRAERFEELMFKPIFHGAATVVLLDEDESCEIDETQEPGGCGDKSQAWDVVETAQKTFISVSNMLGLRTPTSKPSDFYDGRGSMEDMDYHSSSSSPYSRDHTQRYEVAAASSFGIEMSEMPASPILTSSDKSPRKPISASRSAPLTGLLRIPGIRRTPVEEGDITIGYSKPTRNSKPSHCTYRESPSEMMDGHSPMGFSSSSPPPTGRSPAHGSPGERSVNL